jgi:hypothetical protein
LEAIDLVTSAALARARSWEFRLGSAGSQVDVALDDGRRLRSADICGVLNRLVCAPDEIVRHVVAEDRDYAAAELMAFYLGWLRSLRGMINMPTPQGLCGSWRHASEWSVLAARAGLAVPVLRQSSRAPLADGFRSLAPAAAPMRNVIVLRNELHGAAVSGPVGAACRKLAVLSGIELLGIDLFESEEGALMFAHATPLPDLTAGGDALIDGLVRALGAPPAQ